MTRFLGRFFAEAFRPRYEIAEFFRQCFVIGYKSLPLIGLTAFIMGLVLTMQLRPSMVEYGVESQLPAMVGISIVREIGPVIFADPSHAFRSLVGMKSFIKFRHYNLHLK